MDDTSIITTVIVVVGGWLLNEYGKRVSIHEEKVRERYEMILLSLKGFYADTEDYAQKQTFLNQVQLAWLYCSDDFIRKANSFLESVNDKSENQLTPDQKQKQLGELLVLIRKEYRGRTRIKADDFKPYMAKK